MTGQSIDKGKGGREKKIDILFPTQKIEAKTPLAFHFLFSFCPFSYTNFSFTVSWEPEVTVEI